MDKRYAYQSWHCSTCDGFIDEGTTMVCETCGYEYRVVGLYGNAEFIPDPDEDEDYIAEFGNGS